MLSITWHYFMRSLKTKSPFYAGFRDRDGHFWPFTVKVEINRMGRMILITNKIDLEKEEILSFYRKKDKLEKMFDVMKNEITSGRLRVRSQYSVEGRIFITFVSLILYSELHRIMKEKELYSKYTIPEVFFELKKLRRVEMTSGKEYLTEVSKKQRTLFEKFEVPVPVGT